jgi:hypothetical protein
MSTLDDALVRELRQARDGLRGNILRATAAFSCETRTCPVSLIRVGIVEEIGDTKPYQPSNICPRCRSPLKYRGLEVGR